jgi:hypothetical protein
LEFAVKALLVFLIAALDEKLPELGEGFSWGWLIFRVAHWTGRRWERKM